MNANKFAVGLCGLAIWTSAPAYSQQATIAPKIFGSAQTTLGAVAELAGASLKK